MVDVDNACMCPVLILMDCVSTEVSGLMRFWVMSKCD